ncbi:MAG: hypothetical protein GXP05_11740 [Alphaproteobacteria bacterium]|nr:hypothetical protein [Alphaproteobacteria bacterium]
MATSSKVLTVTYGTFSCTLEGFDDPFTTLQMVAEYFRKLAAEDRYFGGVPQVPDADALKRIAEENTPGTIAAEIAENGVILRQTDEFDIGATVEAEPQTEEVITEVEEATELGEAFAHDDELADHDETPLDHVEVDHVEIEAEIEPKTASEPETTSEVKPVAAEPAQEHKDEDIEVEEEALTAEVELEADIEVQTSQSEPAPAEVVVSETPTPEQNTPEAPASPVTFFRSRRHEERAEEDVAEEIAAQNEATPDANDDLTLNITPFTHRETKTLKNFEETLAAIRQNVERAETDAETDLEVATNDATKVNDYDGDEYEVEVEEAGTGSAETVDEVQTSRDEAQDSPQDGALSDPLVLTLDDQAKTAEVEVEVELASESESATSAEAFDAEAVVAVDEADEVETVKIETAEVETATITTGELESDELDADQVEVEINQIQTPETELDTALAAASSLSNEQEAELNRELAEALGFSPDDHVSENVEGETDGVETAIGDEALTDETVNQTPDKTAVEIADEIAEQIAESLSLDVTPDMTGARDELHEPEARDEQVETAIDAPVDTPVDEEEQRRLERRARADALRNSAGYADEDEALDRLLQTTQSKMDRPEQARRLNALEQLKAAVAATEAEAKLHDQSADAENDTTDLDTYREDLRRAQNKARLGGLASTAQPAATPLILVSEQRIDEQPAALNEEPQEPQREVAETHGNLALKPELELENLDSEAGEIQGIPADAFSEATNFADFAERIGAFELQDLLEASAAYTSIIEGKSRFSRAQIMSKITKIDSNGAFTKEAGLRSFGRLLREGKILRVQDGQFAISKASRFSIASRFE